MAARKTAEFEMVNSATIAACFGLGERRVQQFVKEGIIDCEKVGKSYRFDLIDTVRKYVEYLRDGETTSEAQSLEGRKLLADAEYRETKLAQERLKLAELEGTMHRSDDVRFATEQLVYSIRSMLIAMPGRLAVDVAACSSAAEASELIRAEVNQVMNELMEFRYDPQVYKAMVREREGWLREVEDEGYDAES